MENENSLVNYEEAKKKVLIFFLFFLTLFLSNYIPALILLAHYKLNSNP